jgi:alkylated DNA repair dioxygenase AlkB
MDLFNEIRPIAMADAQVTYHPTPALGLHPDEIFTRLRAQIPWEQHSLSIHGQIIPQPRLSSWHGDVIHSYATLAHTLIPQPWSGAVAHLRARVEALCGARFNSMLANLYRDGQDAIGWHADDEPELGPTPLIASLSFGAERRFDIRRKDDHTQVKRITLEHGSLLIMGGAMQQHWQHAMARTAKPIGERINLTFRLTSGRQR